ncbi:MAG: thiol peroxidase [Candidatus Riflebacteria bacterium]|nr:thiol peroxidase [Candidatus Riflebacteria bacterium]
MAERSGVVTFKGNPLTLIGPDLKVGDKAPDFVLLANDLTPVKFSDTKGVRVFTTVPSLDTPVCDAQVHRFNEEAGKLASVSIYAVSADLPFAQKRWCGAAGISAVKTLSDHREMSFATSWGVCVKELRLLARSVFVVDSQNTIVYKELVKEMTTPPNFEAALEAIKKAK